MMKIATLMVASAVNILYVRAKGIIFSEYKASAHIDMWKEDSTIYSGEVAFRSLPSLLCMKTGKSSQLKQTAYN